MSEQQTQIDRRVVAGEIRAEASAEGPTRLVGYAAVFNREAVIDGFFPFREIIRPGAFRDAIATDDVRLLFNHDANKLLARTKNGTMRLVEDEVGLRYEAELNRDDPDAVSVAAKVQRGDVSQSSFAFRVEDEDWDESGVREGKLPLREIKKVSPLYDVSAVTYPAYSATSVSARAEQRARELTTHGEDQERPECQESLRQDAPVVPPSEVPKPRVTRDGMVSVLCHHCKRTIAKQKPNSLRFGGEVEIKCSACNRFNNLRGRPDTGSSCMERP